MSVLTSFLKLFKYQASDDASTFNIDVSLNDNWDKIDAAVSKLDTEKADTDHTHTAADVGADPAGTGAAAAQQVQGNLQTHQADETRHVSTASKAAPVDADSIALVDSADGKIKRVLWSKVKSLFAAATHSHSASDVTSGILGILRGGTGASTAAGARANLGVYSTAEIDSKLSSISPAIMGVYTGDGTEYRTINLGFQPSIVLLMREDGYMGSSSGALMGGLASIANPLIYQPNSYTHDLIRIAANGFVVSRATGESTTCTNVNGTVYRYVAFK